MKGQRQNLGWCQGWGRRSSPELVTNAGRSGGVDWGQADAGTAARARARALAWRRRCGSGACAGERAVPLQKKIRVCSGAKTPGCYIAFPKKLTPCLENFLIPVFFI